MIAALAGCQPPLLSARGTFVAEAPTPVVRADVTVHVSFFGIPLTGAQDVVFVLDRSGSMSGLAAGFAGEDVGMSKTSSTLVGIGSSLVNMKGDKLPSKRRPPSKSSRRRCRCCPMARGS